MWSWLNETTLAALDGQAPFCLELIEKRSDQD